VVAKRPNIVIIMADDMGFSDIGCFGSEIATPHLDGLAASGLRFTQFYNAARCCPTRASLLTGLYPHQVGIGLNVGSSRLYEGDLSANCVTIAEVLRNVGYVTYMTGKWHLTPWPGPNHNWPHNRGFDRFYGTITSIRSFYNPPSLTRDDESSPPPEGDFHYTDAINDQAARFILEHENPSQPFFLYVAHTAPHWPLHAREDDVRRYEGKYMQGWDQLRQDRYRRLTTLGLIEPRWVLAPRDDQAIAWSDVDPSIKTWFDRRMAVYAAMISQMDRGIGRIFEAMRKKEVFDDTVVIFLSDNGACAEEIGPQGRARHFPLQTRDGRRIRLGNAPSIVPGAEDTYASYGLEWACLSNTPFRRFKSFVHEGGIASPMIVHGPGVKGLGRITREVGHVIDLMPTCLELAGATYPKHFEGEEILPLEGKSLVPLFQGKSRAAHEALFWEHEGNRAARKGNWKLVSRKDQPWELFDLAADRTETVNQARRRPNLLRELEALYQKWAQRCGVKPFADEQTPIGWPDNRYQKYELLR
jgi:arylsulfatase